jgi:hypothetical protein
VLAKVATAELVVWSLELRQLRQLSGHRA